MSDHDSVGTESSICEEERLRRLFTLCDENGDGYIDSHDLFSLCKELDMENAFDEIMVDLGTGPGGLIALEEFVQRGLNIHNNALTTSTAKRQMAAFEANMCLSNQLSDHEEFDSGFLITSGASNSIPTSCESLTGAKVESWKREMVASSNVVRTEQGGGDSRNSSMGRGGRKEYMHTSPAHSSNERIRKQQQQHKDHPSYHRQHHNIAHNNHHHPNINSNCCYGAAPPNIVTAPFCDAKIDDIPTNFNLAANVSFKQEIGLLTSKVQNLAIEKDILQKKLNKLEREKNSLQSEYQSKLASQSQRYEERIIELHGVIFEINKQYDRLHGDTIREEDEEYLEEIEEENEGDETNSSSSIPPSQPINFQKNQPIRTQEQDSSLNALKSSAEQVSSRNKLASTKLLNRQPSPMLNTQSKSDVIHTSQDSLNNQSKLATYHSDASAAQNTHESAYERAIESLSDYGDAQNVKGGERSSSFNETQQNDVRSSDPFTVELDALEDNLELRSPPPDAVHPQDMKSSYDRDVEGKDVTAANHDSSSNLNITSSNHVLDDDSLILDIERQTAMACKELEKLGLPNMVSSKNDTHDVIMDKRLSSGKETPRHSLLEAQLRAQNKLISDLELQMSNIKKEKDSLQMIVDSYSAEKQKLFTKISNLEQQVCKHDVSNAQNNLSMDKLSAAGTRDTSRVYNSFTLPKKFQQQHVDNVQSQSLPRGVQKQQSVPHSPSSSAPMLPPPLPPPRQGSLEMMSKRVNTKEVTSEGSCLHTKEELNKSSNLEDSSMPSSSLRSKSNQINHHPNLSPLNLKRPPPPGATRIPSSSDVSLRSCSGKENEDNRTWTETDETTGGDQTALAENDERIIELRLNLNKSESKVARLQSEIDLLQLTLEESKSTSERLSMLCGKHESNNVALKLIMDVSDLCIEALESLLNVYTTSINTAFDSSSSNPHAINNLQFKPCYTASSNSSSNNNKHPLNFSSMLGDVSDCEDEYTMLGLQSLVKEEQEQMLIRERLQNNRRHAETVARTILSHLDNTFGKVNHRMLMGGNSSSIGGPTTEDFNDSQNNISSSTMSQLNNLNIGGGCSGGGDSGRSSAIGGASSNSRSIGGGGGVGGVGGPISWINDDGSSSHDHTSTTSSTNSAASTESDWSKLDENRLRDYIRQLKTEKATIRLTVMEMESIYSDPDVIATFESKRRRNNKEDCSNADNFSLDSGQGVSMVNGVSGSGGDNKETSEMLAAFESQRQDLEYAVLTQELMTLKEEKAELRAQMYLMEKEKKQMYCLRQSQEAQLKAYTVQIEHLKQQLETNAAAAAAAANNNTTSATNATNSTTNATNSQDNCKVTSSSGGSSCSNSGGAGKLSNSNAASAFSQSPRSAFSTLSSAASLSKSEPVSGSEHGSSFTPIITLEQLSSVTGSGGGSKQEKGGGGGENNISVEETNNNGKAAADHANITAMRKREEKLKNRIQELINALESLSKHCEVKDKQSAEYMADLKRANSALISAYDKAKKKHSSRLKKLESQMKVMCERHDTTVKVLRQRIHLLEQNEKVKQQVLNSASTNNKSTTPSETSL